MKISVMHEIMQESLEFEKLQQRKGLQSQCPICTEDKL